MIESIPRVDVGDAVHVAGEDADWPRVALPQGSAVQTYRSTVHAERGMFMVNRLEAMDRQIIAPN